MDFRTCALISNATGAHCVMGRGVTSGIKSFEETESFMRKQKEI